MAWIIGGNAREMQYETLCFSNVETPFIRENIDRFFNISIFEKDRISDICAEEKIDGVIATTELTIPIAAYVAEKLNLPGLPYDISLVITDKYRNRLICNNIKQLHQPRFVKADTLKEIISGGIQFPMILKPCSKGGKRGISVAHDYNELCESFKFAKEIDGGNPVIVEEFISEGKEYSVESLSSNNRHYIIQITEKISSGPPHCVELGHKQPAALSTNMSDAVKEAVSAGLTAIGVKNSTCHTEIKIVNEKIYLIEFNARPGGDHIAWPLTELSTGYPYIKNAIAVATGTFCEIDPTKFEHNHAGVLFVTSQTAYLKPLFDNCSHYPWLFKKNYVSDSLVSLEHNDCYNTNSIMYFSRDSDPYLEICSLTDKP
jgi:carbamoyl-phosphate synthase large subunit